jgi:hypothetical protein
MPTNGDNLRKMIAALLVEQGPPTEKDLHKLIDETRALPICRVEDAEADAIFKELTARFGVVMGPIRGVNDEYTPWLANAKRQENFSDFYWRRHTEYIASQGFANQAVMQAIDEDTDTVLDRLENPQKTDRGWKRRGLVMGHVQSGKTQHYTGLICKAADAGYKVIIVIAGIHNNLRNQTQMRIDQGFIGKDSATVGRRDGDIIVGVGRHNGARFPVSFTSTRRDFNANAAENLGLALDQLNEPVVFVIKKNASILTKLIDWLKDHNLNRNIGQIPSPLLLIDDEADNASINVSNSAAISAINGKIRSLLELFQFSSYIGYTATPFANIFIDPDDNDEMKGDDLFPKHFIYSLDPASNYFGAEEVFLDEESSPKILRELVDNDEFLPTNHKINADVPDLPESLIDALRAFVLVIAVRIARQQDGQHNSMLVNASRFTNIQNKIQSRITIELKRIQDAVRVNGMLPPDKAIQDPAIKELHRVWIDEYDEGEFSWTTILHLLHKAAAPIEVRVVNSQARGRLNYGEHQEHGLNVIAVGGFALSRGLTLENLSISYFLRNSLMYDTLMQMCRWFGYRPGFKDLCRVWMPPESIGWYRFISLAIEDLRSELERLERAGGTPNDFGLMVRKHPGALIVTARNKLGSAEAVEISLNLKGKFAETATLLSNPDVIDANRKAVHNFAASLKRNGMTSDDRMTWINGRGFYIPEVPAEHIMSFISQFENHEAWLDTRKTLVEGYIKPRLKDEFKLWDVCFSGVSSQTSIGVQSGLIDDCLGEEFALGVRVQGRPVQPGRLKIGNNRRVSTGGIGSVGLTEEEISDAKNQFAPGKNNPSETIYANVRKRPLIMIHLLGILEEKDGPFLYNGAPVAAYGYLMPAETKYESPDETVMANRRLLQEWFQVDISEADNPEDEMVGANDE